jgi:hypothetical protein
MQLKSFTSAFKKTPSLEKVLCAVFVLYILMGLNMPEHVAEYIDTIGGKFVIGAIVLYLFKYTHPVTACLALFTAFMVLMNASNMTGNDALARFIPSNSRQSRQMAKFNLGAFPYTLEEEVVSNLSHPKAPIGDMSSSSVQAVVEDTHGAASV